MIEGLIIAAGKSQRTGDQNKMLLNFGGLTMIEKCIDSMSAFCSRIIIVTGYNSEQINNVLKDYSNLKIVHNPYYEDGMYSSIKTGLVEIQASRFFFLPGDCPLIPGHVYKMMLKTDSEIVVPANGNHNGHPVLFNKSVIDEILNGKYINLREFISSRSYTRVEVDSECILADIDTLADYQKALASIYRKN